MSKIRTAIYLGVFSIVLSVLIVASTNAQTGAGTGNIRLREAMDSDGDDLADFSVFRLSENKWYRFTNGATSSIVFGNSTDDVLSPGDYDGDGKGDVSIWRRSTGQWHRINSSNSTHTVVTWGVYGDEPVARDYDGDGLTDFAFARRTGGQMFWYVLKSTGGYYSLQFGLATDFVAPGDYDGDGKFDFTVQRMGATGSAPATFYSLKSSNGGVEILNWGAGDDRVVPGDYDGDGKTDYAVVREWDEANANLIWIIRKSIDGSTILRSYGLTCRNGVPTCDAHPTQNDYDGDDKTDISVWRSNGSFYYLTSSSNFVTSVQYSYGLAGDYPVASYDSH